MLTAAQINELKAKVKTEMARRSGYGSLARFAGSEYGFDQTPAPGGLIMAEHGRKTVNPLLHIKDYPGLVLADEPGPEGSIPSTSGDPIPAGFDVELLNAVDQLAAEAMTGTVSSCRGACSGLCLGTCAAECTGCTGCDGCTTNCTGGCGSGCTNGCYGSSRA